MTGVQFVIIMNIRYGQCSYIYMYAGLPRFKLPLTGEQRQMHGYAAATLIAFLAVTSSVAASAPPANSIPLSEIIRAFEESGDVAYFDEIEWDDDGYWEIEYRRIDGAKVEIKVDPVSGEPRR